MIVENEEVEHFAVEIRRNPETDIVTVERWTRDGKLDRRGGPAVQFFDAETGEPRLQAYYTNGVRHREDGPAFTQWSDSGTIAGQAWLIHGEYHREGGLPAIVRYDAETGQRTTAKWYEHGARRRPRRAPAPTPDEGSDPEP